MDANKQRRVKPKPRMRKADRKRQLMHHAKQLFVTLGYQHTTTEKIAQAAGVTEPVLYRHFANKKTLFIEVLNVAGRRWQLRADALERLAASLTSLSFLVRQPPLGSIARWTARGLTAYDACYVALAEERRTVVITADERILSVAGALAHSLAAREDPT